MHEQGNMQGGPNDQEMYFSPSEIREAAGTVELAFSPITTIAA